MTYSILIDQTTLILSKTHITPCGPPGGRRLTLRMGTKYVGDEMRNKEHEKRAVSPSRGLPTASLVLD